MFRSVRVMSAIVGAVILLGNLPAKADPSWTGVYLGAHGGFGWADWEGNLYSSTHAANPAYAFDPSNVTLSGEGGMGGLQVGINQQFGGLVFGLEIDGAKTDIDAGGSFININDSFRWDVDTEMKWFGTARARVGLATNDVLVYVTGGAAYARTEGHLSSNQLQCPTCPRQTAHGSADEDHFGYTLGGGLEWRFARHWSLKSEYLYADLGKADYHLKGTEDLTGNPHVTDAFPAELELHTVRLGINYQFEPF